MLQVRYMLGDNGRSLTVGVGHKPPEYAAVESASCDRVPATCNAAVSKDAQSPNPQTVTGCLVYGNYMLSDAVVNSRVDASNMAAVSFCTSWSEDLRVQ